MIIHTFWTDLSKIINLSYHLDMKWFLTMVHKILSLFIIFLNLFLKHHSRYSNFTLVNAVTLQLHLQSVNHTLLIKHTLEKRKKNTGSFDEKKQATVCCGAVWLRFMRPFQLVKMAHDSKTRATVWSLCCHSCILGENTTLDIGYRELLTVLLMVSNIQYHTRLQNNSMTIFLLSILVTTITLHRARVELYNQRGFWESHKNIRVNYKFHFCDLHTIALFVPF